VENSIFVASLRKADSSEIPDKRRCSDFGAVDSHCSASSILLQVTRVDERMVWRGTIIVSGSRRLLMKKASRDWIKARGDE